MNSFNRYLLNIFYILDTGDTMVKNKLFVLRKLIFCYALDSARYRDERIWNPSLRSDNLVARQKQKTNLMHL